MSHQLTALPPNAILVHIGPHKTGTTSIQSMLAASRHLLRQHGVLYPGRKSAHHTQARALNQSRKGWGHDGEAPPDPARWTRFAARSANHDGRVVISSEFFSETDAAGRAQLVRDLGAERVFLVSAARNPAALAVSSYQQVVRTFGRSMSLETWLDRAFRRADPSEPPNRFWQRSDPAALTAQWTDVVPAGRITLVVLDEGDRRLLPATFEQLLGLPAGLLADHQASHTNRGLTAAEVALIRRINAGLQSRVSWAEYTRTMRAGVIRRLQQEWRPGPDDPKDQLPSWAVEQALVEADRSIDRLRTSDVRIVGDLASLRTVPDGSHEREPITQVPVDLAAEAVIGAIAVATRNSWSLDAPRKPRKPRKQRRANPPTRRRRASRAAKGGRSPRVDALTTRDVAGVLAGRLRAGVRRRSKRLLAR
jgi:hypothetical protein